jgi:hypothetical protein
MKYFNEAGFAAQAASALISGVTGVLAVAYNEPETAMLMGGCFVVSTALAFNSAALIITDRKEAASASRLQAEVRLKREVLTYRSGGPA